MTREAINPSDTLLISVTPATRVYCSGCGRHVAYLKRDEGGANQANLAPLPDGERDPPAWVCVYCHRDIRAWGPEAMLKTDKGYLL
jgi:hypothetical protein